MKVVALAGGVGGAKLADGIYRQESDLELTVIVNTGDDFSLFGLWICPDLDTVCYNLAEMENPETGWGRDQESWVTLSGIRDLGGLDWFSLGDKDLATHLERTRRLAEGQPLSQITRDFCHAWGIQAQVIPMSDDRIPTLVETDQGIISFQEYFVKLGCEPPVKGFRFHEVEMSCPAPGVLESIQAADLVLFCPSNPWVSIDPILQVPGIRPALDKKTVLAVSPIIGGKALKGPAAKMYQEMNIQPSALAVAAHYGNLLDGFVIDEQDRDLEQDINSNGNGSLALYSTDIWMKTRSDRLRVAKQILKFGRILGKEV